VKTIALSAGLGVVVVLLAIAIAAPMRAASPVSKPTVTVSWRMVTPATAREDSRVDRGTRRVPLDLDDACKGRFRLDRLSWIFDASDAEATARKILAGESVMDLRVSITKLFSGPAGEPSLEIRTPGQTQGLSLTVYDVRAWRAKGYVLRNTFDADHIDSPKSWIDVTLRCR
jgi:hypothetical protein